MKRIVGFVVEKWGGQGDNCFSDYGLEQDGVVANLTCSNCGASAEFWTAFDEDLEE